MVPDLRSSIACCSARINSGPCVRGDRRVEDWSKRELDLKLGAIAASSDTHTNRTVPGLESLSVNYERFAQAAIIHLVQDRYAESAFATGFGGAAGLIGASRDYDIGTTTLGLRTEYKLAALPGFTLRNLIGWRYAYGDVRPSVSQSFAGAFGSFTVAGVPVDRNAFVSETNLDYAVSAAVTVGLSYAGQFGNRSSDNAFKGHVDVNF